MKQLTDEQILQVFADCHKGRLYPQDMVCGPRAKRITEGRAIIAALTAAKQAQPDLIPQESLFVCGQMGANVTKVYAEQAQPARPINCGTGHCSCIECPYEQAQPERAPLTCTWTQEDDFDMPGVYHTSCGEMWSFTEGGIKENNTKFCPHCGGGIKQGGHQCLD